MSPILNVMVDLETMSTQSNAVILSMGACAFDINTGEIGPRFYQKLNYADVEQDPRFHVSKDTMEWWEKQSPQAREEAFSRPAGLPHYSQTLQLFKQFVIDVRELSPTKKLRMWANDPDFDIVILNTNMALFDIMPPWQFWESRSVRTMKDLWENCLGNKVEAVKRMGTHHNALDDSIHQALVVSKVWRTIRDLPHQEATNNDRAQSISEDSHLPA